MRSYADESDDKNREMAFIDNMEGEPHYYWIEADVPVPMMHHETVIAGEVQDGD